MENRWSELYQNDVFTDVKDSYLSALKSENDNLKATQMVIAQYTDYVNDQDDCIYFWLSLANTQWDVGRLLPLVKDKALEVIQNQDSSNVLHKLKEKLIKPQPPEKKFSKERKYICSWNAGDAFAFQICDEAYCNHTLFLRWIIIQKVKNVPWYPHHEIPVILIRYSSSSVIPSLDEIENLPFIPIAKKYHSYNRATPIGDFCYDYCLGLVMTSKRNMPHDFTYLGNLTVSKPIEAYEHKENSEEYFYVNWKSLTETLLKNYETFVANKD